MEKANGSGVSTPQIGNWLSVADAAMRLRITHRGVLSRIQRGKVEARRDPRDPQKRRYQVLADDLDFADRDSIQEPGNVRTPLSDLLDYLDVARQEIANVDSAVGHILAGAQENGIVRILPPRRTELSYQSEIISLLKRTEGSVKVMGISCNDFFADGGICNALVKMLERSRPEEQSHGARFLILYPCGSAARARMFAEEHDPRRSLNEALLFLDIEKTLKRARTLCATGLDIQVRLYDFVPPHQLTIFNEGCLVEQYSFGSSGDQRGGVGCIGGFAPVIECKPSSDYYASLLNGFDHVWNGGPLKNGLRVYDDINAVLREMETRGKEHIIPEQVERRVAARRRVGR